MGVVICICDSKKTVLIDVEICMCDSKKTMLIDVDMYVLAQS